MAKLDATFRNLAVKLTNDFGGTATLETVTKTHIPATGLTSETVTTQSVKISQPEPFEIGAIDGTLVQEGDMTTLLAAKGLTNVPVANESRLIFDTETWQITGVDPIYSGDQVAAYQMRLRQ